MNCKTCRFCRYNAALRHYTCNGWRLPDLRVQKMGDEEMTEVLKRALKHEQALNELLRERVMELETEVKTLKLRLQARYAGEVDDN